MHSPSQVFMSAFSSKPDWLQAQSKPPSMLVQAWEQGEGSVPHSSISEQK